MATEQLYDAIYRQATFVPGYSRYQIYADIVLKVKNPLSYLAQSEPMYWAVRDIVGRRMKSGSEILEVGSGLGYLTYALNHAGHNCIGVDISEKAVKEASQRYGPYFARHSTGKEAALDGKKYDLVIATEVLEHCWDPRTFIQELRQLIKPKGALLITTPLKPKEAKAWDTELPPIHWTWATRESIAALAHAEKLHFEEIATPRLFNPTKRPEGKALCREPFLDKAGQILSQYRLGEMQYKLAIKSELSSIRRQLNYGWKVLNAIRRETESTTICALLRATL